MGTTKMLLTILFSLLLFSLAQCKDQCGAIPKQDRIDCHPDPPVSREQCAKRRCCWDPSNIGADDQSNLLPLKVGPPSCYFGQNFTVGYRIVGKTITKSKVVIRLKRDEKLSRSGFPREVEHVEVSVTAHGDEMVRVRFIDMDDEQRFEVPIPELDLSERNSSETALYDIEVDESRLMIKRRSTGQAVFNVNLAILIYSDQFLQITNQLPSNFLYGLGEHRAPFYKQADWQRYTMMNRDPYATLPNRSLYGSHPFYMTMENPAKGSNERYASGVFLFNQNPMDVITQPSPAITYRTIGGILDFFIFFGPKPEDVVQQYHQLIGLPQMPPYWSLGYHLSRYGYSNLNTLKTVYERTRKAGIPYDVQWTDIDMFEQHNDFTYDPENFKDMPDFINNELHKNGMKFIPMFDPGISGGEPPHSYAPFDVGVEIDVFVKNSSDQIFYGRVWNAKSTVWPDFFNPKALDYWSKMFEEYHSTIAFDGAWIDMNEPANLIDGQIGGCPVDSNLESPQYTPGMTDPSLTLRRMTLCMTAKHHNDTLHYNLHNLYGFQEAIVTNLALKKVLNKRPFIISRSTAPGHGHWASHWTGDINADWSSMQWTIPSILNFNIFGIPMVGADICGFHLNTTVELCTRWHQLGAFYTFARNHNDYDCVEQDPVALGPQVINATKNALLARYALLPYLYTLFHQASTQGGTVIRPLFFEFPEDESTYKIETQFMWGKSIMIAPALEPNQTQIEVYFPKGRWFSPYDSHSIVSEGQMKITDASKEIPNIYFRSGSILPMQQPSQTTEESRKNNLLLRVILENATSKASGQLYWDSGDGLDTQKLGHYNLYDFNVANNTLTIQSSHLGFPLNQTLEEISIVGIDTAPKSIKINGKDFKGIFEKSTLRLFLLGINLSLYEENSSISHQIQWKYN